jgi:hypothetical protein
VQLIISEEQQLHVYACLQAGGEAFAKAKKSLAKVNREDPWIDGELTLNAELRRIFNPRAEEEAREAERAKRGDADQMTIGDELGANYNEEDSFEGRAAAAEIATTRTPHDDKLTVDEALADEIEQLEEAEDGAAVVAERAD